MYEIEQKTSPTPRVRNRAGRFLPPPVCEIEQKTSPPVCEIERSRKSRNQISEPDLIEEVGKRTIDTADHVVLFLYNILKLIFLGYERVNKVSSLPVKHELLVNA